ncbi:unnamed protein product [Effrenium voratum]|uniref:Uncharacterized protein n=1 Tax=Effrenium voratum TaxID=2562239 RepID=A0AA36HKQ5_9DINO|nr:unnamed protein product [Effrenium voratum]
MPISTRLRRILAQSGRTTQWRLCLHLWAQKPCAVAAAAAISACGRAAHWDQSLALYDHWLRHDQPSDPAVLNSTLAACAHAARWVLALTLLEEAKRHHRAFDLLGLNSALNACGRAARWEVSLALLMQLQKQRLADATSVNSTISACDRAAVWQLALSLLYTHRADLVGASAALSACARGAAWASALAVLHAHRANAVSFGAAITACGRSTRWRFALQLLGDALKTTSRASLACFSAAVSACELGAAWEAALVVLSKAARDWPLDRTILNATISSCEKGWQWDRCLTLLHATDAVTCGAAAEACASAMRWVEALSLASRVDSVVATAAATRAKEDAQHAVHRRSGAIGRRAEKPHIVKGLKELLLQPCPTHQLQETVGLEAHVARIALENMAIDALAEPRLQKSQGAMKLFAALDLPSPWKRQGWCLYRCLPAPAAKVAGFDFDKTLHFGGTAWKLSSVHIPEKLKRLQQDGYTVVIFSNQHGPGRQRTLEGMRKEVEDIVRRFEDFRAFCGMELHMFVAVARGDIDDPFRKPNTGMWDLMSSLCSSPKVRHSFYVGNSAGRLGDDSAVDRGFAKRLGMTFYSEDWLNG